MGVLFPAARSPGVPANPAGRPTGLLRLLAPIARRPFRVVLLAVAIALMSMVDLYLTMLYLTHTGMSEANPVARAIIAYQSPVVLAVWKTLTVALCVGILFLIRERRSAELGAWFGAAVLGLLMAHWTRYIDYKVEMTPEFHMVAHQVDPGFVRLGQVVP